MIYYLAPVQGHTDAAYRHFHAANYGKDGVVYTTPFIRLEKGEIRKKDLKDALSPLNEGLEVLPQVIFRDSEELTTLVALLREHGATRIDINMGCPFPLQTARGRGAATIASQDCHKAVADVVRNNPGISFSVKMRLGMQHEEWRPLIEVLNTLDLDHISVHPRTAADQYTGQRSMEAFTSIYEVSTNPIVYNGDIPNPDDARIIIDRYPGLQGIMIGRGLLGRPSLISEIKNGTELEHAERLTAMSDFHRQLLAYYRETLIGGEHQVLTKIQPFWEYAEAEIGRKAWKAIKKASTMAKYQTALAQI